MPDGFISIASRTISSRPSSSRCLPEFTDSQILANLSKSACLDDSSGCIRKCGSTLATRSPTFRTSNLSVLSDLSGRMNPHPHFSFDHVKQLGSLCVLADREARSHLPTESMTIARLERNAETTFTIHETGDVGVQVHRQGSGPACYGLTAIQGSQPLSRYGDQTHVRSYPRYYPRHPCTERRWGFTDLSRLNETVSPPFRAMLLTRQGISLP